MVCARASDQDTVDPGAVYANPADACVHASHPRSVQGLSAQKARRRIVAVVRRYLRRLVKARRQLRTSAPEWTQPHGVLMRLH